MRNFLRQDWWALDVVIGLVFAIGFGGLLVEAGRDSIYASPSYGLTLLPFAAFIVTSEFGSLVRRNSRFFRTWLWMPLVGAIVFAVMTTITTMPVWLAVHHRMEPRLGILPRPADFAFDAILLMSIAFVMWAVPAIVYSLVVRFTANLFTLSPGLRSIRLDPITTVLGLTLFAATLFGSIWLTHAAH